LNGTTSSAPALTIDTSGTLQLVVRGIDNGIYHKSKPAGGAWSSSWDSPGGTTKNAVAIAPVGHGLDLL
jgi:hypothetical protein